MPPYEKEKIIKRNQCLEYVYPYLLFKVFYDYFWDWAVSIVVITGNDRLCIYNTINTQPVMTGYVFIAL